jgi:predicted nucleic acid-binding protein
MGAGASADFLMPDSYMLNEYDAGDNGSVPEFGAEYLAWLRARYGGDMSDMLDVSNKTGGVSSNNNYSSHGEEKTSDLDEDTHLAQLWQWLVDLGFNNARACDLANEFYDHGIISCQHLACEYASDRMLLDDFVTRRLMTADECSLITSSSLFTMAGSLGGNTAAVQTILQDMVDKRNRATTSSRRDVSNDIVRMRAEETQTEMMAILDNALSVASTRLDNNNYGMTLIHHSELFGDTESSRSSAAAAPNIYHEAISQFSHGDPTTLVRSGATDGHHVETTLTWSSELVSSCVNLSLDGSNAEYRLGAVNNTRQNHPHLPRHGVVGTVLPAVSSSTTIEVTSLPRPSSLRGNSLYSAHTSTASSNASILSVGVACKSDYVAVDSAVVPCFGRTLGSCGIIFNQHIDERPGASQTTTITGSIIENNLVIEQFGALMEGDLVSVHVDMEFEVVQIFLNSRLLWTFTSVLALVNLDASTAAATSQFYAVPVYDASTRLNAVVGVTMCEGCAVKLLRSRPLGLPRLAELPTSGTDDIYTLAPGRYDSGIPSRLHQDMEALEGAVASGGLLSQSESTGGPSQMLVPTNLQSRNNRCPQPQLSAVALRRIADMQADRERRRTSAHHQNLNTSTAPSGTMTAVPGGTDQPPWYTAHMESLQGGRSGTTGRTSALTAALATAPARQASVSTTALAQVSDDQSNAVCVVCMEHPKCIVLLPCRHMCLCENCGESAPAKLCQCPMCREDITMTFKVFV